MIRERVHVDMDYLIPMTKAQARVTQISLHKDISPSRALRVKNVKLFYPVVQSKHDERVSRLFMCDICPWIYVSIDILILAI